MSETRTGFYRTLAPETGAGGGASGGSGQSQDGGKQQGQDGGKQQGPLTWDAWSATLTPEHKQLLDQHFETRTQGLKSALDGEREGKKALEKQLRDAAAKAEAGSVAQQELAKLADQVQTEGAKLSEATTKASAYEVLAGSGCTNLRLAYLAAREIDAFDKKGGLDVEALRKQMPELFGRRSGDAGAGTNGQPSGGANLNALIRRAAGRA